ncbi:MAG: hypothetical protein EHM20_10240 [Alphaproteobacteria bacterium]|nr:MAG: hypothetical protein EHM20_10240 [Alphaproteobacteria bacterium]
MDGLERAGRSRPIYWASGGLTAVVLQYCQKRLRHGCRNASEGFLKESMASFKQISVKTVKRERVGDSLTNGQKREKPVNLSSFAMRCKK